MNCEQLQPDYPLWALGILEDPATGSASGALGAYLVHHRIIDAKPTAEIVNAIRPKVDQYYEWVRSSGRLAKWARMHRQYYAGLIEGAGERIGRKRIL